MIFSGLYSRTRGLCGGIWQTRLRRKWSRSRSNREEFGFGYRRSWWSVGTWIQILCSWKFHGWPGCLGLSKVYPQSVSSSQIIRYSYPFWKYCNCGVFPQPKMICCEIIRIIIITYFSEFEAFIVNIRARMVQSILKKFITRFGDMNMKKQTKKKKNVGFGYIWLYDTNERF